MTIESLKSQASWSCSISVDSSFDVSPSNLLTKASWRQTLHNENIVKSCWWDKADEEHVIYGGKRGKRLISKLSFGCTAICQSCEGELGCVSFLGKSNKIFWKKSVFARCRYFADPLCSGIHARKYWEEIFHESYFVVKSASHVYEEQLANLTCQFHQRKQFNITVDSHNWLKTTSLFLSDPSPIIGNTCH